MSLLFDNAIQSVTSYLRETKEMFISANIPLHQIYEQRAEMGVQVQLSFLDAFKVHVVEFTGNQTPKILDSGSHNRSDVNQKETTPRVDDKIENRTKNIEEKDVQTPKVLHANENRSLTRSMKRAEELVKTVAAVSESSALGVTPKGTKVIKKFKMTPKALAKVIKQEESLDKSKK